MARSEIPVDLFNPGQVFACLGFMEAADALLGEAFATFRWQGEEPHGTFALDAAGDEPPVQHVLRFVAHAEIRSLAPPECGLATDKWQVATETLAQAEPFPFPAPPSPATLPAVLRDDDGRALVIEHWGDDTRRDSVKFWAGSGGYPGVALLRDAIGLFRDEAGQAAADPFAFRSEQSSAFRLDWRRDYVPIDAGFSPNDQPRVTMGGFPVVEVMAAIGLSHARPARIDPRDKLAYRYGVIGGEEPLDPVFLRAALGAVSAVPGLPFRRFAMRLAWPGQENQARCIIDVMEITGGAANDAR